VQRNSSPLAFRALLDGLVQTREQVLDLINNRLVGTTLRRKAPNQLLKCCTAFRDGGIGNQVDRPFQHLVGVCAIIGYNRACHDQLGQPLPDGGRYLGDLAQLPGRDHRIPLYERVLAHQLPFAIEAVRLRIYNDCHHVTLLIYDVVAQIFATTRRVSSKGLGRVPSALASSMSRAARLADDS
jgi:hypothetical protein